jgi:hypothetical protein
MPIRKRDETGKFIKESMEETKPKCSKVTRVLLIIGLALVVGLPWIRFFKTPISKVLQKAAEEFDEQSCPDCYPKDKCFRFARIKLKQEFVPEELNHIERDYLDYLKKVNIEREEKKKQELSKVRSKAEDILIEIKASKLAKELHNRASNGGSDLGNKSRDKDDE